MSEMDDAYKQDYSDKRYIDDLRATIRDWLDAAPSRISNASRAHLEAALEALKKDSDHIVAVWD